LLFLTIALLLLAAAGTITISVRDPRVAWSYEIASFLIAAVAVKCAHRIWVRAAIPLVAIALWGCTQLLFATTVYCYATVDASLRMAAFAATFVASAVVFSSTKMRETMLAALAWFGFAIAILGALAYYTSPHKLLWIFPSLYPDTWGLFLSRNNFAQFLELVFPVALWRARRGEGSAIVIAATILAAGIASASRAGAILLIAETLICLSLLRGFVDKRSLAKLGAACILFVTVGGATQLWGRLQTPDPLEYRREFAHSALAMIAEHPWLGFGLGTFASVYPAYAEFDPGATVDHAHDDWLEWAAEGGVPFAAAWIVLAIVIFLPALRSIWGVGVVAIFLHALVDYPFARFGITGWFFVLAGAVAVSETQSEKSAGRDPLIDKLGILGEDTVRLALPAMAVALALTVAAPFASAAPPVIGTIVAKGPFRMDNAMVQGNATLFEGASIETTAAGSSMELTSGARIALAEASKGRFFGDHVVLEKGAAQLLKAAGLKFEARGLIIQPETGNASARVLLAGANRVDVSVITGSFRVLNLRGVLVANLGTGRSMEFEPQPPNTPSKISGCLIFKGGHYLITDETTNVIVEVAGLGLDKEKGNRVELAGAMDSTAAPVSDASQFIRVSSIKHLSKGCAGTAAAGAGGAAGPVASKAGSNGGAGGAGTAGAGGGGAAASISTTTIAIIGGVAAAGAVGGLLATGKFSGSGTVSR
jgi:O-antigen ligase